MITKLKKIYHGTRLGGKIIHSLLILRTIIIPQKTLLKMRFKRLLGYPLNIKNPETFNEKLQWLKINDRSDFHTICADKFAVREHIKNKIGEEYLIPLVLNTTDMDDISKETLPDYPVIIKTNHDSGGVSIVWDKNNVEWIGLRKKFKELLKHKYGKRKGEWQYKNISPRVLVEKLLLDEKGEIPSDYKLFCFNGKVEFIQVDLDRQKNHKRNLYDKDWQLLDFQLKYENGPKVTKPLMMGKMIELAQKLAADFIHVRVDLYTIGEKIYFGELTFHTESGFARFTPQIWDYKIGQLLKLPIEN